MEVKETAACGISLREFAIELEEDDIVDIYRIMNYAQNEVGFYDEDFLEDVTSQMAYIIGPSLEEEPQEDVEEYRRLMAGRVPIAFVTTPVALTPEQTKTLADTLSSLIDRRVELQVSIDTDLIVGIQVRLADKLIDNSLRQQLDHIRTRAREDLISRLGATT